MLTCLTDCLCHLSINKKRVLIFSHPLLIFPYYLKICVVKKTKYPLSVSSIHSILVTFPFITLPFSFYFFSLLLNKKSIFFFFLFYRTRSPYWCLHFTFLFLFLFSSTEQETLFFFFFSSTEQETLTGVSILPFSFYFFSLLLKM